MKRANWFLTGILIALVAGLALSGCATTTTINSSDLPVLPKMPIIPATPNLSPKTAAFLGTWEGMWDGKLEPDWLFTRSMDGWPTTFTRGEPHPISGWVMTSPWRRLVATNWNERSREECAVTRQSSPSQCPMISRRSKVPAEEATGPRSSCTR